MVNYPIYFQDLKEDIQGELWQAVGRELLARGDVEYREEDESEEEFQERLQEAVDDYVNCHNFAHEFSL